MPIKNTKQSFGAIAKGLHWVVALLILLLLLLGYFMEYIPASLRSLAYATHKLLGIVTLVLMVLRLGWRLYNVQPADSSASPAFLRFLAHVSHAVIYGVAIVMPFSGWLMSTAAGKAPQVFGKFALAMPGISLNKHLAGQALQVHATLAIILIGLLVVHIFAACMHHFVWRDQVLTRMLFKRKMDLQGY